MSNVLSAHDVPFRGLCSTLAYRAQVEGAFDALADHLETHLNLDRILAIARTRALDRC